MSDLKEDLAALRIERAPEPGNAGKIVMWVVVVLLLGGGAWGGYKYFTRERPVEVELATVTQRAAGTQAAVLNASGYVTARRRATVSSKITGKVVEVNVEEGKAVKEGQVLARLDDVAYRAALALAKANLGSTERSLKEDEVRIANAKVTLERKQKLVDGGFAMKSEVDDARLAVDALEARLEVEKQQVEVAKRQIDLEQTNLDNTVIRAPFSGIAISKDAQPGEMVSPVSAGGGFTRTGICTIVDMRSLEIEVDVNESYINRVKPGQNVSAILDAYADWQIPAHVITVVPTADRQKATVLVRIGFKQLDPRILPDMGVKVTFLKDEADAKNPSPSVASAQPTVLVPKAAILNKDGQDIVFVVKNDRVERVAIKVGGNDADRMEVLAGLSAGDRVVVSPPPTMANGALVTIKK
ncbi:MAG: efflux RND transporter periplasmic adaptor subunit [Acidobacteria bacterium]|nr:MAG: efflux RND transporter periplasmic adaptor subunit [Acidobacteriota bacterium]